MIRHQTLIKQVDEALSCGDNRILSLLNNLSTGETIEESITDIVLSVVVLHKVVFLEERPTHQKRELVSIISDHLSQRLYHSEVSLADLFPDVYLIHLLFALRTEGIDCRPLLDGFDLNEHEQALLTYIKLCNNRSVAIIENLAFLKRKLKKDTYQRILLKVALQAARLDHTALGEKLYSLVKDTQSRLTITCELVIAFLANNDLLKALSFADHFKESQDRARLMSTISSFLLGKAAIEDVTEILKREVDPMVRFEILYCLTQYYITRNNQSACEILVDQCTEIIRNTVDPFTKAIYNSRLTNIEIKLGRENEARTFYGDALFIIENTLDFEESCKAFNNLLTELVTNDRYELADSLLRNRWGAGVCCTGQHQVDQNLDADIHQAVFSILTRLYRLVQQDQRMGTSHNDAEIAHLYGCAFNTIQLLDDFASEDYLLFQIACSYAQNGYYEKAVKTAHLIKDKDYKIFVEKEIPVLALEQGEIDQSIELTQEIEVHEQKLNLQLSISPAIAGKGLHQTSRDFLRNWAIYQLFKIDE
jgi:hypothetical protein